MQSGSRFTAEEAIIHDQVCDGLVIDDFFVLGVELASLEKLKVAKAIYEAQKLIGSDDKDVLGSPTFRVCGAEVCSSYASVGRGLVSAGTLLRQE